MPLLWRTNIFRDTLDQSTEVEGSLQLDKTEIDVFNSASKFTGTFLDLLVLRTKVQIVELHHPQTLPT